MKNLLFYLIVFISVFALLPAEVSAQVQLVRVTYVTANGGSDANTCSRTSPCRQIQRALSNTIRGGTVVVLDSGEYDPFTITRSVSVVAERGVSAVVGSTTAAAGAAIDDDGTSAQVITIRGLTFVDSDRGISVNATITSLSVEDCSIAAGDYGIYTAGAGRFAFKNINVAHTPVGVRFAPGPSQRVVAVIDDSRFDENGSNGVEISGTVSYLTIRNSIATYNVTGFLATGSSRMAVENSVVANNTTGIKAETSATVSVGHSTVTNNGTGFRNSSSTFRTFGNNSFSNNTTSLGGTITLVSQQ